MNNINFRVFALFFFKVQKSLWWLIQSIVILLPHQSTNQREPKDTRTAINWVAYIKMCSTLRSLNQTQTSAQERATYRRASLRKRQTRNTPFRSSLGGGVFGATYKTHSTKLCDCALMTLSTSSQLSMCGGDLGFGSNPNEPCARIPE